jgi:hypothetical protein
MFTPARYKPVGFQQISAATLAAATALTVPAGANVAIIRVGVASTAVSWRDDGTAPTAAIGMQMLPTDDPFEYSANLAAIQFILSVGLPTLGISYYQAFV